jgi:hypothetical protein
LWIVFCAIVLYIKSIKGVNQMYLTPEQRLALESVIATLEEVTESLAELSSIQEQLLNGGFNENSHVF